MTSTPPFYALDSARHGGASMGDALSGSYKQKYDLSSATPPYPTALPHLIAISPSIAAALTKHRDAILLRNQRMGRSSGPAAMSLCEDQSSSNFESSLGAFGSSPFEEAPDSKLEDITEEIDIEDMYFNDVDDLPFVQFDAAEDVDDRVRKSERRTSRVSITQLSRRETDSSTSVADYCANPPALAAFIQYCSSANSQVSCYFHYLKDCV